MPLGRNLRPYSVKVSCFWILPFELILSFVKSKRNQCLTFLRHKWCFCKTRHRKRIAKFLQKFQFSSTNCFVSEFVPVFDFSMISTENQRKNLCLHSLCITIYQRTFVVSTSLTFQLSSRSSSLYSEVLIICVFISKIYRRKQKFDALLSGQFCGPKDCIQPNLKIGLALAFRLSQWQFVKPSSQDLYHEFLVRIFAFITIFRSLSIPF